MKTTNNNNANTNKAANSFSNNVVALACGCILGVGLALSGMTDVNKVQGFLDLSGRWDPALIFVMGAALCITVTSFRFILKSPYPLLSESFKLPTKSSIDKPLIIGAVLFGIGWGLVGYCPGPAISSLAYLNSESFVFVASMLFGGFLGQLLLPQKHQSN